MTINSILKWFLPKEDKFFILFEEAGKNMQDIAGKLKEFSKSSPSDNRTEQIRQIDHLEHVGDKITHKIITELNSTFITPIDREDIHYLASAMDDVVDFINLSAYSVNTYDLKEIPEAYKKLCDVIVDSAKLIYEATRLLKQPGNAAKVREVCMQLNELENVADGIYIDAITELFKKEKDPIQIIRLRETLSSLELATDKAEDVANVIETIIIKTA